MAIILKNNAKTTLSSSISSTDTTIPVSDTSSFPALGVGEYFYCTLESTTGAYEIVKVTQVNASSFIATRAQEDTIAIPFSAGTRAELRVTVQSLEDHFADAATDEAEAAVAAAIGVTVQGYDADTAKTDAVQTWTAAQTFSVDINVPDEVYGAGWDGSTEAPTKNALYDKINAVDATLAGLETSVVLKGTWDASAGTFPGAGVAQAGWSYIVSVGGTVDSTVFAVGDRIIAILDNASTTTYANNWFKADYTDAVSTVAGKTGAVTLQVADITDMTANGRSLVSAANYAAMRTLLDLEPGVDYLAYSATTANGRAIIGAADYAAMRTLLDLEAGVDFVGIGGGTYTGDVSVPDEAYGVGWNGSVEVPTKNAIYDKIEAVVAASGVSDGDKGDITVSGSGATWTIDSGAVTLAKMANVATDTVFYRKTAATGVPEVQTLATLKTDLGLTGTNSGDQTITLTGDVTGSGTGSFAATIANDAVTYAKMQNVSATSRVLGRITAGAGDVEELTATNIKTILALVQADISGLTTASSPQFTAINLGHASDTTLARSSAGNMTIEGNLVYRAGGTDVPVTDGGTGASDAATARTNLGLVGKTSIPVPATAMTPRTTNPAGTSTTETTTNKVTISALDFDASTAEYAQFVIPAMPKSWDESTVTMRFIWTATNTGDVVWGVSAVAISDDDVLDAAFGTQQTVTDSVTAANDVMKSAETSAITIGGTPAEGDMVVFQVFRNAASGSDTCTVDARLIGVELFITTNAAVDV